MDIEHALGELRLKLLDLTGRNRLINFKHTAGRSIQFVNVSLEAVYWRLTGNAGSACQITYLPDPPRADWVIVNGRTTRPDPKQFAQKIGVDSSYELAETRMSNPVASTTGSKLQTLFYGDAMGTHCRKILREANSAIQETGANMLFLVFGFLEFPENPTSDKLNRAPILCVPVKMERTEGSPYMKFNLVHTGEEITENLSLREKVARDFGIQIPEFEDGQSLNSYFDLIEEVIQDQALWRVRRMLSLTLLSFSNMLIFIDLEKKNWESNDGSGANLLVDHPIIQQVFQGGSDSHESAYAKEYDIDDGTHVHLPLIFDADSSQHSALIDVLSGKNLVIEGPPGTGKSQTITNIIAAALDKGMKVLFVAEKLAALEVVKARLERAGLSEFILELHSNKTNKKKVISEISSRIEFRPQAPIDIDSKIATLESKRIELKGYVSLLNSVVGNNLGLTVHQVLWRVETYRKTLHDLVALLRDIRSDSTRDCVQEQFQLAYDSLGVIAKNFGLLGGYDSNQPFWGFTPEQIYPGDESRIQDLLISFSSALQELSSSLKLSADDFGIESVGSEVAGQVLNKLSKLDPTLLDPSTFSLFHLYLGDNNTQEEGDRKAIHQFRKDVENYRDAYERHSEEWEADRPASFQDEGRARKLSEILHVFDIANISPRELDSAILKLEEAVSAAKDALADVKELAEKVGYPPIDDTKASIDGFLALIEVAHSAPSEDVLKFMHDGLFEPATRYAVHRLTELHSDKLFLQTNLEASVYLDMVPDEATLKHAILTLREGSAWYRVFQSGWRKAIKTHKKLQKEKSKARPEDRLTELEAIHRLMEIKKEWGSDEGVRRISGPFFKGLETPIEPLLDLATWVDFAAEQMDRNRIDSSILDIRNVDRRVIDRLREHHGQAVSLKAHFDRACHFKPFEENVHDLLRSSGWSNFLGLCSARIDELRILKDELSPLVSSKIGRMDALLPLVQMSHALTEDRRRLESNQLIKDVLGECFQGVETDFGQIDRTMAFCEGLAGSNLSPQIQRALLSESVVTQHAWLTQLYTHISDGWSYVRSFPDEIGKYGPFAMADWLNVTPAENQPYINALQKKTDEAAKNCERLQLWSQYLNQRNEGLKAGFEPLILLMEQGSLPKDLLPNAYAYTFYSAIADNLFRNYTVLSRFNGQRHSTVREEYAALDREIIKLRGARIAKTAVSTSNPPSGRASAIVAEKTQMELIHHVRARDRARVTVRQILSRAGDAIQELKPCFMMGPQAVAQFLKPGGVHFDLVIMDEASQMTPEEALGSIARGSQLVVVGDPKQLPPTSFFSRQNPIVDDGAAAQQTAIEDAESILDICMGHFTPVRTLRWHYRSKHESLIAFSNEYFYGENLFVFPSPFPKGQGLGLRYVYVDGVYESQMNKPEAARVVEAMIEHVCTRPDDSLGVVTLNIKQRDLISELWEETRKSFPEVADFEERWEKEGYGLFIKNLENVQGDERDSILISTTFGKAPGTNVVRQNFGPISRNGGWRRLNVLFTRARKSVGLITSMKPEDIVTDGSTPDGTVALRNYLEYAKTGVLNRNVETHLPAESEFEINVIDLLLSWGYQVTPQLGVAGFRIDIAVRHPKYPSVYLAAIECDGATYHSAVSVRDRDRIRQEILESLGWKGRIWRIWSTDWFRSPVAEGNKLRDFLRELEEASAQDDAVYLSHQESFSTDIDTGVEITELELNLNEEAVNSLDEEDEEFEISVGDIVTYAIVESPEKGVQTLQIGMSNNPAEGVVGRHTPLGMVLMGATAGERVVLNIPGQATKTLDVLSIKREPVSAG